MLQSRKDLPASDLDSLKEVIILLCGANKKKEMTANTKIIKGKS